MPLAEADCEQARRFFSENFAVKSKDTINLINQNYNTCLQAYEQIEERLKRNDQKKILFLHVFAGHGVQKDGKQTLLVNEHEAWDKLNNTTKDKAYEAQNHFYARFEAETITKDLADKYEHSYHLCIFVCCREMEKLEYDYISNAQAINIVKEESSNLNRLRKLKQLGGSFRNDRLHTVPSEGIIREHVQDGPVQDQKVSFISSLRCSNFAFVFGSTPGH